MRLYVDGILQGEAEAEPHYGPTPNGTWIGGSVCCGEYFSGRIDEVGVHDRALPP